MLVENVYFLCIIWTLMVCKSHFVFYVRTCKQRKHKEFWIQMKTLDYFVFFVGSSCH